MVLATPTFQAGADSNRPLKKGPFFDLRFAES
jgi:hypothetical protein